MSESMTQYAPIVLFVYNRLWHTQQTVEALQKNILAAESELFIYSDAPNNDDAKKSVNEVRDYIDLIDGFKKVTIIKRDANWGLARSIIDGVTKVVNDYGRIIVLEDDLVTSPYFLNYMNDALNLYENDSQVASIHGYIYPIRELPATFFIKGADCWGWATWENAWSCFERDGDLLLDKLKRKNMLAEFDYDKTIHYSKMLKDQIKGKNNSWAIRWYASVFLSDMLTLYPGWSYVYNIGNDASGTHCHKTQAYNCRLIESYPRLQRIKVSENLDAKEHMKRFFKSLKPSVFIRLKSMLKRVMT